jgi:hypothetical protein
VDAFGNVFGEGWEKLRAELFSARLWPNTFPIGGGSARVEAYYSGVAVANLGLNSTAPYHTTVALPFLDVGDATVFDPDAYFALCQKLLYDGEFSRRVTDQQRALAASVADGNVFWKNVVQSLVWWRSGCDVKYFPSTANWPVINPRTER